MVALNIFSHFLGKEATPISAVFIAVSVGGLAGLFFFPHRVRKPDSDDHGPGLTKEPATDPHTTTLKLVRIQPQTDDAKTLRFLLQPGKRFSARPGQFLTFDWTVAGKQICRSYSICSSPMQSGYIEITSKKVANGRVSQFLNESAMVGLHVQVLVEAMGVPPAQILRESFGTPPTTISPSDVSSSRVEFVHSGLAVSVAHERTLLDAAEAKGLPIPYGCRQGFCGTCATRLLSGNVRMERQDGLPADLATKGFILPCVSYAMGDLRLDV